MSKQKVEIEITAADKGAGSTLDGLLSKAKQFRKDNARSGENAFGRYLNAGPGGLAAMGADALGIGAPLALIEFGGRSLKAMADEAIRLRHELAGGSVSAGEMVDQLMGAVPVFGQVWQAGRSIHELISGEKEATAQLNEEAKRTNEFYEIRSRLLHDSHETLKAMRDTTSRRDVLTGVMDQHPSVQKRAELEQDLLAVRRETEEKSKNSGFLSKESVANIAAARTEIQKLKEELAQMSVQLKNPGIEPEVILRKWMADRQAKNKNSLGPAFNVNPVQDLEDKLSDATTKRQRIKSLQDVIGQTLGVEKQAFLDDQTSKARDLEKQLKVVADQYRELVDASMRESSTGASRAMNEALTARLRAGYNKYGQADYAAASQDARFNQQATAKEAYESARRRIKELKLDSNSPEAKNMLSDAAKTEAAGRIAMASAIEAAMRSRRTTEGDALEKDEAIKATATRKYLDAESESRQKRLVLTGKGQQAERERIMQEYALRVLQAKSVEEKDALGQSAALDLYGLVRGTSNFSGRAAPTSDRFASGTSEALLTRTATVDMARNTKNMDKTLTDLLTAFRDYVRQNSTAPKILTAQGNN